MVTGPRSRRYPGVVTPASPSTTTAPGELLRDVFGFDEFRVGQERAVQAALDGRDALVLMATGAGKSLCYQLPALGALGLTIVVSPLIALMRDQVEALRRRGRSDVAAISSASSSEEVSGTLDGLRAGTVKLLYVAPERFASARFASTLEGLSIDLFVVDEAHCLSEWGHDFRPDYGRLADVRDRLGVRSTMALTATATPRVADDIVRRLRLRDPERVETGVDRPNLTFDVAVSTSPKRKLELLTSCLQDESLRPAIIYARSRRAVDDVSASLGALAYHAGMSSRARREAQEAFMSSSNAVIVCTNAFGMGVDKADVRSVWHWNLPNSPEAYYQEAGRAGRDGLPARCVLLYTPSDRGLIASFIQASAFGADEVSALLDVLVAIADSETKGFTATPGELAAQLHTRSGRPVGDDDVRAWLAAAEIAGAVELAPGAASVWHGRLLLRALGVQRRELVAERSRVAERVRWDQLRAIEAYATADGCRRQRLVAYFGFGDPGVPEVRCCDLHEHPTDLPRLAAQVGRAGLREALVALAGEARPSLSRAALIGAARGSERYRLAYSSLVGFGCALSLRSADVESAVERAVAEGALEERAVAGAHRLVPPGNDVHGGAIARERGSRSSSPSPLEGMESPLVDALRAWRSQTARGASVPAYVVARDRTLAEIAHYRPATADGLERIFGVGPAFLERYGDAVLALLSDHR